MEPLIIYLALLVLIALAVVAWLSWRPVARLNTVEFQVQEFNRQMRQWESEQ